MPIAMRQTGSGRPMGLAIAAAICLFSGLISEAIAGFMARTSPLAAMLIGMMVRMALPLGVCVALVSLGQNGRDHLAFIVYLLALYMVALAFETRLAVKRAAGPASTRNQSPR
ncbi:MAG: hypothetical protein L0228_19740 [Planctomycetes bacterium]|nr:hypothetical protein [Planctomycetota bacterium]